jgi:TRAP-type C4-dicarboxylate transport system substrate-binding protein
MRRLSADERQAVRQAAASGILIQRQKAAAEAQQALDAVKQNGVRMIEIDRARLADEVKPLWQSFTDQHPDSKPVLQAILKATGRTL